MCRVFHFEVTEPAETLAALLKQEKMSAGVNGYSFSTGTKPAKRRRGTPWGSY